MNLAEIPQRRVNEFIAIAAQAAAVKPDIFWFCIKITDVECNSQLVAAVMTESLIVILER